LPFLLVSFVVIAAVGVLMLVLVTGDSGSPMPQVSSDATMSQSADAETTDSSQITAHPTPAVDADEGPLLPTPDTAVAIDPGDSELEVKCLRYRTDQKWNDLDSCADQLKEAKPALAKELKARATLEGRAVPRINAFEIALRDRNLKKAQSELEALVNVTSYAKLKQRYEQAENAAIQNLIGRLDRAKDSDCKEYNQIVQQEKATKPPRVVAEATSEVLCVNDEVATPPRSSPSASPPSCDHEELAEEGKGKFALGKLSTAFEAYEAAWNCHQDATYAEKAFIIACNIPSVEKARLFWKRLPQAMQTRALGICTRNDITEDELNGP
jgi:hypothetical protein